MTIRTIPGILMGVMLATGAGAFAANGDESQLGSAAVQAPSGLLPLVDIVRQAQAQHPGQVVEAELERKHGRYIYEVEIVDDKGVKTELKYDAETGELLSSKVEQDEDEGDEEEEDKSEDKDKQDKN